MSPMPLAPGEVLELGPSRKPRRHWLRLVGLVALVLLGLGILGRYA